MVADATKSGNLRSLHFVITKWDYVQKTGQSLDDVKRLLFSLNYFADFVRMLPSTRTTMENQQRGAGLDAPVRTIPLIRLIPISAVGFNFVKDFSPEQGMIINQQAQPEPWNVAAPLACAFVDIIKAELVEIERRRRVIEVEIYSSTQTNLERLTHMVITKGLNYIPRKWLNNEYALLAIKGILEEHAYSIQEREDARYRDFTTRKESILRNVKDNEAAFAHAANMCMMIEQNLDKQFPANVIQ